MNLFRSDAAETALSGDGYALLMRAVFRSGWASEADKAAYLDAWRQPGALTGDLNFYRANIRGSIPGSADSPKEGAESSESGEARTQFSAIDTPAPVIWGEQDSALLTGNLDGLEEFVSDLTIRRIPDGTHWVVHEKPAEVHQLIRAFLQ